MDLIHESLFYDLFNLQCGLGGNCANLVLEPRPVNGPDLVNYNPSLFAPDGHGNPGWVIP